MENTFTENKPGYKKTKFGWIPEDWEICRIKDVLTIGSGKDYKHLKNGTIPVYGSGGVMTFVDEFLYDGESVGIGRKGTIDKPILLDGKFWTVDTLFYTHSFKNSIPKFIFNVFLTIPWKRYNAASSIPSLSKSTIDNIKIKLPPLPEQKAIANCLSTWDTAITKLDALIKAKQKLKKALMQQLLSGKKRLLGFEGEWEEKHISELFDEIKDTNDGGEHEPLSISAGKGFKSQREKFDRVIAGTSLSKYIQLKKGDFAYNKGNSKSYKMGCIYLLESFNTALVPFVFISFRPTDNVNSHFYKHYFMDHGLDRQLKRIITSGARGDGLLNVSKKDFFKLFVPYPKKKEQTAIAQVLNTADQEINLLTNQRNQLQLQKKGLMQQLLTGKKRLQIKG